MKKIILVFIFNLFLSIACFAQSNYTESLTITTYYPAPYGVYRNLKLNPTDTPSDSALSAGVMYYDNGKDMIRYYNKTGAWVNMTGGGGGYWVLSGNNLTTTGSSNNIGIKVSGDICNGAGICLSMMNFTASCGTAAKIYTYYATSYGSDTPCGFGNPTPTLATLGFPPAGGSRTWSCPAVNSTAINCTATHTNPILGYSGPHRGTDCTAAGGTVVGDGLGNDMCKLASCGGIWTQFASWSNTPVVACSGALGSNPSSGQYCAGSSCSVGLGWTNAPTPSLSCSYNDGGSYYNWQSGTYWCAACGASHVCATSVTQMGCY